MVRNCGYEYAKFKRMTPCYRLIPNLTAYKHNLFKSSASFNMSPPPVASGQAPIHFDVHQVMNNAYEQASHSWEYGTAAEALRQLRNPELSIFSKDPFPACQISTPDI